MAMHVREIWTAKPMSASGTIVGPNGSTSGVLCTTAGTLVVSAGVISGGTTLVAEITMTAGTWYPLPFKYSTGAYATLGGGAVVTFGVS